MRVRRLQPVHTSEYRALMLQAYGSEPAVFTSTVHERERLPLAWWEARVSDQPGAEQMVFGAFEGAQLVGVAGLRFGSRERTRHKATLFGMFVLPAFTGQGIGRALVNAVLEQARTTPGTRVVQLTVTETNAAAIRLYESCGFRRFGLEPLANRVGQGFVSKVHMWCMVSPDGGRGESA